MNTPRARHLVYSLMLLAAAPAVSASAPAVDDSKITVSGAAGIALPLHGDFDFNAPE